jgi:hypothetical protein
MLRLAVMLVLAVGCRRELCSECDPIEEYCVIAGSDISSVPGTSECLPLPTECAAPSCSCLETYAVDEIWCASNEVDAGECTQDEVVTWFCPGG